MGELRGKTVLITGGARGIGQAIARLLAEHGAAVIATSRGAAVEALKPEFGKTVLTGLDVTSERSVADLFKRVDHACPRLDVLVNNAGIGIFKPLAETSLEEWNQTLNTNVTGVFLCSREAFLRMKRSGGGRILNIGSVADHHALAGNGAYGASKHGVRALTEILNEEGKAHAIRASLISPGAVRTEIWQGREGFDPSEMLAPQDVAESVLDIVRRPLHVRIDEVRIVPPKGIL